MQQPLFLGGKLASLGGVYAIRPGPLIFVRDQNTGVRYLVDTGAAYSIIPGPASATGPAAETVNGASIATGGEATRSLRLLDSNGRHHNFNFTGGGRGAHSGE